MRLIRRGQPFQGNFPDAVWGGRDLALVAAQRYRDKLLLRRAGPDTRVRRKVPNGRRSRTGIAGVSFEEYVVEGHLYHRYVAHWQDADKEGRRRRFGVGPYGDQEAKALAAKARRAGLEQTDAERLARQREEAARRLQNAPPMPSQVKDPRSRKGISMARRRPRRARPG